MEITNEMAEAARALSEEGSSLFMDALQKMHAVRTAKGYNHKQQVAQIYTGFLSALAGSMAAEIGPEVTNELMAIVCAVVVKDCGKLAGIEAMAKAPGESVH